MKRIVVAFVLAGTATGWGCRGAGTSSAPDAREFPHAAATIDRHAPSFDELKAFTYTIDQRAVRLKDGQWRDGAASVVLEQTVRLTGDITGNGTEEAIVVLEVQQDAAMPQQHLAVVGWVGGQLLNLATVKLPDAVTVTGGHVEPHRVILEMTPRTGGERGRLTYELAGTALRLVN